MKHSSINLKQWTAVIVYLVSYSYDPLRPDKEILQMEWDGIEKAWWKMINLTKRKNTNENDKNNERRAQSKSWEQEESHKIFARM